MVAPFMPDAEKLAAVREALPALSAGIYLATPAIGPLPAETAAAIEEYAARELRTGRGHPDDIAGGHERIDEARGGVAAILGTDVDAIALTHGGPRSDRSRAGRGWRLKRSTSRPAATRTWSLPPSGARSGP